MKKYLMTGVAALAFAATFTSCSKTDLYDENKVNEQKEVAVNEKYAAAFEKAFGKVGANVDWGFSSTAKTRGVNVNGNMWKEVPEVTNAERTLVFNYVNMTTAQMKTAGHKYTEKDPQDLTDYWVTQVYEGTSTYNSVDNTVKDVVGSDQMNNLRIAQKEGYNLTNCESEEGYWYHVNNFNSGNNTDWNGNTAVYDSHTYDFAYHNSSDSKYHNKWIAVKGSDIDASLSKYLYICFDFVGWPDNCQTPIRFWVKKHFENEPNRVEYAEYMQKVPGAWTTTNADGMTFTYDGKEYTIDLSKSKANGDEIVFQVENVEQGNMAYAADNIYTDWIIRLVAAEPDNETHLYRVIAEDLSAGEAGDFDFNDVVFDVVKYDESTQKTTLRLQACGGTLPLMIGSNNGIGGVDVHKLFGDTTPDANGKLKMWNTGAGNSHDPVDFEIDGQFTTPGQLLDLRIEVQKDGQWFVLTAERGEPACKILVDDRFKPIVPERHSIANEFGNFTNYVTGNWKDENEKFWWIQE